MTTFLHTADWQLGKPFARVVDDEKRTALRQERLAAVRRIGDVARERNAAFVVVAGDLFDSNHPPNATVSAACDAIASIGVPVYVIPGNHDHAGPGSVWEQDFFLGESRERAPNLRVLLEGRPVEAEGCVLLPCPLHRRQTAGDPCRWIAELDLLALGDRPRVVIAHGSTLDFSGERDDEDATGQPNFIDLGRLPLDQLDYVALGDWHGLVQAGDKAWYSGSHETDRFPKAGQTTGHVAVVRVGRGTPPVVEAVPTGRIRWLVHSETFAGDDGPAVLHRSLNELTEEAGRHQVLLKLSLTGSLGLAAHADLESKLRSWESGLLDLRLERHVAIAPSSDEIDALVSGSGDPLIAHVAGDLREQMERGGDEAAVASLAIALLHEFARAGGDR